MLTDEQRTAYERDGYVALPGFVDAATCAAMMARIGELVAAFDPATHPLTTFETGERQRGDDYFLRSGSHVSFFYEKDAVDGATGRLRVDKGRALNKIGHALHVLEPLFRRVTCDARIVAAAHEVGLRKPVVPQSMYIFKQPHIGGEVAAHQVCV